MSVVASGRVRRVIELRSCNLLALLPGIELLIVRAGGRAFVLTINDDVWTRDTDVFRTFTVALLSVATRLSTSERVLIQTAACADRRRPEHARKAAPDISPIAQSTWDAGL